MTDLDQGPADPDAERAVLGGILLDSGPDTLYRVLDIVAPADFTDDAHQAILTAATELADQGRPVDPIAVHDELTRRGQTRPTGGAAYLHTLADAIPALASATYYARLVARHALRRRLIQAGAAIARIGHTHDGEDDELLAAAETVWDRTAQIPADDPQVTTYAELVPRLIDALETDHAHDHVVPAPYADLREALAGGFRPGQLIVIGARPGHGKTTLALDIARHAATTGHRVLFHNLEMTDNELGHKLMAATAKIPLNRLTAGAAALEEPDWHRLRDHVLGAAELPIVIDHEPHCPLARIRGRLRALRRAGTPAELVIIDYLQLIDHPRADTREQQIAATSRALKLLAREHDIPVVLLAQLNREAARRGDDEGPRLSDFRESGAVEQDCNIALLLHNPAAEDPESPRAGTLTIRIAKNRGGPLRTVDVAAQLHYARCVDLAPA